MPIFSVISVAETERDIIEVTLERELMWRYVASAIGLGNLDLKNDHPSAREFTLNSFFHNEQDVAQLCLFLPFNLLWLHKERIGTLMDKLGSDIYNATIEAAFDRSDRIRKASHD